MKEDDLIELLSQNAPSRSDVIAGIGEDCAVIETGLPDKWLLFKVEAVVENIHFESTTPAKLVGRKALNRSISDIAAMGGIPTHALITIGIPDSSLFSWVQEAYEGIYHQAKKYEIAVVGGETTRSPKVIFINISLLGYVEKDRCIFRNRGLQVGDGLFVTGELGGSLDRKHLEFEPRLEQARWLTSHFPIRAMIDLSDGLATDLPRMLKGTSLGAELLKEAIPISKEARLRFQEGRSSKTPLEAALTDGEDFELLFALPPGYAVALLDAWKRTFPDIPLSCVGKVINTPGIYIRSRKTIEPLDLYGYDHLTQS